MYVLFSNIVISDRQTRPIYKQTNRQTQYAKKAPRKQTKRLEPMIQIFDLVHQNTQDTRTTHIHQHQQQQIAQN